MLHVKYIVVVILIIFKSAYETLYALLENHFSQFPVYILYERIIAGLTDQHDICAICILILTKLLHLAPNESRRRLNELADAFRQVLGVKPKENAVKTEIDRLLESQKGILKVSIMIQRNLIDINFNGQTIASGHSAGTEDPAGASWKIYWDMTRKNMESLLKDAEEEMQQSR